MTTNAREVPGLARRLTLFDAVVIGLGSMIGAGVFSVFAPAAGVAGAGLLIGLAIASVIAFCNATSSAQLAVQYPTSGGAYVFGRERLGEWPGFLAGWSFLIGKSASCAAMALTFSAYAVPAPWQKLVAVVAVLALATVNLLGVTRTATLSKILVTCVLGVLIAVIATATPLLSTRDLTGIAVMHDAASVGWFAILQSSGLLFFAFAGYARIATMAEEVTSPSKTIPRAIVIALSGALVLYAVVGFVLLARLGADRLADSDAPILTLVLDAGASWMVPVVQTGAALAALGALLALIAGVGRTTLAMARTGDLPAWLEAVHPRSQVPHHAELALALAVCALVVFFDLRQAIGFSSFGVLLYYFVANLSAFTQDRWHRRYPRVLAVLGALGCAVLVAALPWPSIAGGAAVVVVGVLYRAVHLRRL